MNLTVKLLKKHGLNYRGLITNMLYTCAASLIIVFVLMLGIYIWSKRQNGNVDTAIENLEDLWK